MQCGKKGELGLRIQASDAMDSFVEPRKRKRSCSVPVQRASDPMEAPMAQQDAIRTPMAQQVSPTLKNEVPMDVGSSQSSGTGPTLHHELPTVDDLEDKLKVERECASALRDEVDILRKQTAQSHAVLMKTIKYLVDFRTKHAETASIVKVLAEKSKHKSQILNRR